MSRLHIAAAVLLGIGVLAAPGSALARGAKAGAESASASRATPQAAAEATAGSAAEPLCTRQINERGREVKVKEPIELEVRTTDPVLNFGDGRGTLYDYVVMKASKAIPPNVPSAAFEIDSLEPLRRIGGEGLESARLRVPTYSRPHFFNHRTELGFSLCVTAASGKPGTYTGQFLFVGPGAIASVPITQTAQLKIEEWKFLIALVIVLIITLVFLAVRALAEFDGEAEPREVVVKMTLLLISVAAAGLAMYLVYDKTPTWGDDLVVNGAALIATAFTAAGLGNTLAAGTGKISDSLAKAKKSRQSLKKGGGEAGPAEPGEPN
ncbi:MAG TPA: hypothetical protein VGI73_05975 [Solirubrobacterales bacterium]